MKIYLLLGVPVIGGLSPDTKKTDQILCDVCKRRQTVFSDIEYVFDRWDGQDIFVGLNRYFISERLKNLLGQKNINGYILYPVKASFSRQTTKAKRFGKNAYQQELPQFYHLDINGRAEGDIDAWYEVLDPTECEGCKENKKMLTIGGMHSMSNPELIGEDKENPLPRNVYRQTWNNDDIFLLQDSSLNLPVITQNFVDCLTSLGININQREGVWIREIQWIEQSGKA